MDQKILIIDAHPVYVNKTIGFLQGLTFKNIRLAKTGKEGIEQVQSEAPDLIILSGMLPDMESVNVCKKVTELTNEKVKIIVQVGLFTEESLIQLFKSSGAHYVLDRKEKDWQPMQKAIEELLCSTA